MSKLYLGLVHYPIRNKNREVVTTSVTNLDIHDISRSSKTFNVENFFIITPLKAQHELMARILGFWDDLRGINYNPDRHEALQVAKPVHSIEDAIQDIHDREGVKPIIAVTGANFTSYDGTAKMLKELGEKENRSVLLLFGTGYGLVDEVVQTADFRLDPIQGPSDYNHLSVRSAVAIYLDRYYS